MGYTVIVLLSCISSEGSTSTEFDIPGICYKSSLSLHCNFVQFASICMCFVGFYCMLMAFLAVRVNSL